MHTEEGRPAANGEAGPAKSKKAGDANTVKQNQYFPLRPLVV